MRAIVGGWLKRTESNREFARQFLDEHVPHIMDAQPEANLQSEIEAALLRIAAERPGRTFCLSDVAHDLRLGDWRSLVPAIRDEAERLVSQGRLRCRERGEPASSAHTAGPIRLSL